MGGMFKKTSDHAQGNKFEDKLEQEIDEGAARERQTENHKLLPAPGKK